MGALPCAAIFMDLQMPNLKGLEATWKIRGEQGYESTAGSHCRHMALGSSSGKPFETTGFDSR